MSPGRLGGRPERSMNRQRFALVAAIVLGALLLVVVVRPALERGGLGELGLVAGAVAVILLVERWLRSR